MNLADATTNLKSKCFDSSFVPMETITYNGVSMSAHAERGQDLDYERGVAFAVLFVEVSKSDVSAPAHGDTVVYDGETWSFRELVKSDSVGSEIKFHSDMRPEVYG